MSFKSNGTSSSHNNGIKGEAVGAKPTKSICKIPIKKCIEMIMDWSSTFTSYMFTTMSSRGTLLNLELFSYNKRLNSRSNWEIIPVYSFSNISEHFKFFLSLPSIKEREDFIPCPMVWERSLNQKHIVIPKIIDTIISGVLQLKKLFSHSSFSNRPERNATNFLQHSFIKQDKKYIHWLIKK